MRSFKVIVVGAGPSGGSCAIALARRGVEVVLLDKSKYPRTKVCGSGLSPRALGMLEHLEMREHFAAHHGEIRALDAIGPEGNRVRLAGEHGAWVVPRIEFDNALAQKAVKNGADFRDGVKVTELVRDERGQVRGVDTTSGTLEADLVICANGSPSRFERPQEAGYGIRTLMGWWRGAKHPSDGATMIWDRRLDGYYAWSFPEPDGIVNIGLTIPQHSANADRLKLVFEEILDEHYGSTLVGAEQIGKWMGHPATVTTKIGEVAESHALWIGEAARLVCPGTVEGISFAMESGIAAANVVTRNFVAGAGLSVLAQKRYRVDLGRHMLPVFWAGEGFVRLMRVPAARRFASRFSHLPGPGRFSDAVTRLLGARREAAQRRRQDEYNAAS